MTKSSLARTFGLLGASALLAASFAGCKSSSNNAANTAAINNGTAPAGTDTDPADGNLAPASGSTQVLGASSSYTPQQQGESYQGQAPAPVVQGYNDQDQADESAGEQAVEYADQPPPPLPDYDQPPDPDPNYIWTPGYWAWGDGGYYWVPGAWCPPPYYGALWTPPYWGYYNGRYGFHHGYWGPHIGYYGGVDYGFGYIGIGYFGGYWRGNNFYYNRSVTNVGRGGYTYDHAVVYNNVHYTGRIQNRVSYNGGNGGINSPSSVRMHRLPRTTSSSSTAPTTVNPPRSPLPVLSLETAPSPQLPPQCVRNNSEPSSNAPPWPNTPTPPRSAELRPRINAASP